MAVATLRPAAEIGEHEAEHTPVAGVSPYRLQHRYLYGPRAGRMNSKSPAAVRLMVHWVLWMRVWWRLHSSMRLLRIEYWHPSAKGKARLPSRGFCNRSSDSRAAMIDRESTAVIQTLLEPRERLLWAGAPKAGIVFRASDAMLIPMSLFFLVFSIVWLGGAILGGAPVFFWVFGVPFVVLGLFLFVGRFFWDAAKRKRTQYALTDRRVVIVSELPTSSTNSIPLGAIPQLIIALHRNGAGTITFGAPARWYDEAPIFGGMNRDIAPRFDVIEDAQRVYGLIREATTAASQR